MRRTSKGLANRLGIGARQLRRLFRQHVGASPIAVAQTRRVLLAKQLIHETSLPMAEVALASGFNSVRRFNETFLQLFGRPPATLRRARDKTRREAGALSVRLAYRPPYDWDAILSFLGQRAIPGVEARLGRYLPAHDCDRRRSRRDQRRAGGPEQGRASRCDFQIWRRCRPIIARLRRVFDLAADPDMIGAHLSLDPVLAPLVSARPGLRVPGAWDGFELAVRAIFGQQITVPAATKLLGRLVLAHGAPLPAATKDADGLSHLFPSPSRLAGADLAVLGMPNARAVAVTSLAAAISADPTMFSRGASLDEAIAKLRSLPGIGEWTAQYIAMRELREPDAFPAADIGLMRAMATATAAVHHPLNCCRAPSDGGRGAPMRRCTCGLPALRIQPRRRKRMNARQPDIFNLDRLETPIGVALLVTDDDGVLRALDWEDYEPRMKELLRLHYGDVGAAGRAGAGTSGRRCRAISTAILRRLNAIKWRVAGTPFQRKVWTALRRFRRARR